jgi:uncharacterized protein with GYD domain
MYSWCHIVYMLRSPENTCMLEASAGYLLVNCHDGQERAIRDKLREVMHVSDVLHTFGNYDIVAKIESPTIEELRGTISRIRSLKGVRCTTTLICPSI